MRLSAGQLEKLADLSIDLAKGLFLSAAVGPVIVNQLTLLFSIRTIGVGIFLVFVGLKAIKRKEVLDGNR